MTTMLPMIKSSFDRLREEIDHTFDRWLTHVPEGETTAAQTVFGPGLPQIDMEEDEKEIRVTAELPGLEKDEFKVELTGNRLVIHGEKKTSHEEKKRNYYISELSYGSFSRSIPLPDDVDASKAEASYKNGVLSLKLPRSGESKAKLIDVKVT